MRSGETDNLNFFLTKQGLYIKPNKKGKRLSTLNHDNQQYAVPGGSLKVAWIDQQCPEMPQDWSNQWSLIPIIPNPNNIMNQ